MAEAEAALNKYEKDVARLTPLAEKRAIPQQDLDNAIASVDVGKASVLSAQARVESAQLDLGYCDIRAPIAGLIGAKSISVGELVGKGEPTLLTTISTLDPIWFYCAVSEVEYLKAEAEVRRTGRRGVSVRATGAWDLHQIMGIWRDLGVAGVRDLLGAPPKPAPAPAGGQAPRRRMLVHASGFASNVYADVRPAGDDVAGGPPGKLWHASPGSSGW